MSWFITTLWWYFVLFVIGIIFFPLTSKIFGRFFDRGYAFSKTIAVLVLSYSLFFLGIAKVMPFLQESILLIALFFLIINYFLLKTSNKKIDRATLIFIVFEEILFFAALVFWVYVRGQEPSIRGLEKFMDFGFINSILKSKYFPPLDMWFAGDLNRPTGFPINYYYFGHLTGAVITKLTNISSAKAYNLILATIFALSLNQIFSLTFNLIFVAFEKINFKKRFRLSLIGGVIGTFLTNLGGNLHTIYAFTTGYPNEAPVPFWQILSKFNPTKYWYPNATRFIAFTIHEFPVYSYVVADLHGHVFDIPFVSLTLALLLLLVLRHFQGKRPKRSKKPKVQLKINSSSFTLSMPGYQTIFSITLGFLTAVHYMTNAFDGPIYLLLTVLVFLFLYKLSQNFLKQVIILSISFVISVLPFSSHFSPFVAGIGVNCAPSFLVNLERLGPFLFEKGNCQISSFWMLFILWGFFWVNFVFLLLKRVKMKPLNLSLKENKGKKQEISLVILNFVLILFSFGVFLVITPEFFYIKDIYPGHFRANTMFKLGYQSFMISGIVSAFAFIFIKTFRFKKRALTIFYLALFIGGFFLVSIYPSFAIPSYYGSLQKKPTLDGASWLSQSYPEYKEVVDYLNKNVEGQPTILEAQGDSYTDYNVVSAYTGLPTVAGWWVHEWLWRGNSQVVGERIPDIEALYQDEDLEKTKNLIKKYQIRYIIVGSNERQKYKDLAIDKFSQVGNLVFTSSDGNGKLFYVSAAN